MEDYLLKNVIKVGLFHPEILRAELHRTAAQQRKTTGISVRNGGSIFLL
jgi:hypothetical protein